MRKLLIFSIFLCWVSASPDPILRKTEGLRYGYMEGPDGKLYLLDRWLKLSDLQVMAQFDPDRDNEYHLFTRANPSVSQPLVRGNEAVLRDSNFDPRKKTAVVIHGWGGNVVTTSNTVLIPAFLAAADLNVIAVDWRGGSLAPNLIATFENTVRSGRSVAGFLNWLLSVTGQTAADLHINGFSLGGHHAGLTGRYVNGTVAIVTALDPTRSDGPHEFRPDDGGYTEVVTTHVAMTGSAPLGHVDIYPNGGDDMPGCDPGDVICNHHRAFHYFAESLVTGGFTAQECETYQHALKGKCTLPGTIKMGGLEPKTGIRGAYYLETHAAPPFSKG